MNEETRNRNIVVFIVILMLIILVIISILLVLDKKNNDNKKIILEQKYISENNLINFDKYYFGIRENKIVSILNLDGDVLYLDDFGIEYDKLYKTNMDTIIIYDKKEDSFRISLFDGNEISTKYDFETDGEIKDLIYDDILLGFIEEKDDITKIYELDGTTVKLENTKIVPDKIVNGNYIINSLNSIIATKDELYGAIDLYGKVIVNFDYEDLKNTYNNSYVAKVNNKYGVVSKKKEVVIPITNNYIVDNMDGYVVINKKINLYNKKGEELKNKEIKNKIKDLDIRNNNIYFYDKEYSDLLIIDKKIYIIKNKITELDVDDYYYNEFLAIYDEGNIVIYDEFFNKVLETKIDVDKINKVYEVENNNYYIEYFKNNKLYRSIINKENNKSISSELVYKTSNYLVYKEKKDIIFKSYYNQILETISSNDIIIVKNSIVLDNVIYKISIK